MVGQALMSSRSFLSNTSVCSEEKHARLEKDLRQRRENKYYLAEKRAFGVMKHESMSEARSSRGS